MGSLSLPLTLSLLFCQTSCTHSRSYWITALINHTQKKLYSKTAYSVHDVMSQQLPKRPTVGQISQESGRKYWGLACPFARSLAPLTRSLAPDCSLRSRPPLHSLVHSLAHFAHSFTRSLTSLTPS